MRAPGFFPSHLSQRAPHFYSLHSAPSFAPSPFCILPSSFTLRWLWVALPPFLLSAFYFLLLPDCGFARPSAIRCWNWLALIGWSAAAMLLKARDQSIEWTDRQREARLHLLAQNSRFVILAQRQQYPNLASRALSLCLQRLSEDWQARYHHPIVMVETFVDRESYPATAYKASGWQPLGYSSGFKRVAQDFYQRHDRPKELWVKELDRRAWRWLRAKHLPPHLARYEKSTPPVCALKTEQMPSLWQRFEQVSEWRQPIGKRHKLPTVLAIVALACLRARSDGHAGQVAG